MASIAIHPLSFFRMDSIHFVTSSQVDLSQSTDLGEGFLDLQLLHRALPAENFQWKSPKVEIRIKDSQASKEVPQDRDISKSLVQHRREKD